jgi:anti-sigma-K factor RskA
MKTLRETKEIDQYLLGKMSIASRLLFEARLLIDPTLKLRVEWQQRLYSIIKRSGRREMKSEVARIHRQLFSDPAKREFQTNVFQLFSKK